MQASATENGCIAVGWVTQDCRWTLDTAGEAVSAPSAELLSPVARTKGVQIRSLPQMLKDTGGGASVRVRLQAPSSLGGGRKLDALSTYRVYHDNE